MAEPVEAPEVPQALKNSDIEGAQVRRPAGRGRARRLDHRRGNASSWKELRAITLDAIMVDDFDPAELRSAGYATLHGRPRRRGGVDERPRHIPAHQPVARGPLAFSRLVCWKAPYLRQHRAADQVARARPRHRYWRIAAGSQPPRHRARHRAVQPRQFVGGLACDVSIPPSMRWIPKGRDGRLPPGGGRVACGAAATPAFAARGTRPGYELPFEVVVPRIRPATWCSCDHRDVVSPKSAIRIGPGRSPARPAPVSPALRRSRLLTDHAPVSAGHHHAGEEEHRELAQATWRRHISGLPPGTRCSPWLAASTQAAARPACCEHLQARRPGPENISSTREAEVQGDEDHGTTRPATWAYSVAGRQGRMALGGRQSRQDGGRRDRRRAGADPPSTSG